MGEAKRKLERRKEMLLSCAGVQTMAGKVQVRWETVAANLKVVAVSRREVGCSWGGCSSRD